MRLSLPYGLRSRIALLILLGVLPVLSLVAYVAFAEREKAIAHAEHDSVRLARLSAEKEGALIEAARQLTIAVALLPAVIRHDTQQCNAYARTLLAGYPHYNSFGVASADGELWCSSLPTARSINLRNRGYFEEVVQLREPVLGGLQIGRLTGLPSIVYASPLFDDAGVNGVVFASLRASAFGKMGREGDLPPGASYLVIDHDGKVLSRFPDEPGWHGRNLSRSRLFRQATAQNHGTLRTADVDDVARMYGFAWTGKTHS